MTRVEANGDLGLIVTRNFRAPRSLVYDAYTKPELLQRWLGVRNGWTMDLCEIDLRVGGKYHWVWRQAAKNQQMGSHGIYLAITPPERLVCTEQFDEPWYPGEALNTVEFIERDSVTTLSITMKFETKEARDGAAASGMERGLEESFAVLDAILAAPE
jgi:uncharacterized protein YndB with AHSA1/START domain